jgi:hypothetical protein
VLGRGHTQQAGGPHAEVMALRPPRPHTALHGGATGRRHRPGGGGPRRWPITAWPARLAAAGVQVEPGRQGSAGAEPRLLLPRAAAAPLGAHEGGDEPGWANW